MSRNKKIIISIIGLIITFVLFGLIWFFLGNKTNFANNNEASINSIVNISEEEGITDECTEEWLEYNNELQTAFEEASVNAAEENAHYLIKSENGYIYVYYLDENNEEILYKKTTISVDYLAQEDIDDLEIGIEVIGNEELNKILEDFE